MRTGCSLAEQLGGCSTLKALEFVLFVDLVVPSRKPVRLKHPEDSIDRQVSEALTDVLQVVVGRWCAPDLTEEPNELPVNVGKSQFQVSACPGSCVLDPAVLGGLELFELVE